MDIRMIFKNIRDSRRRCCSSWDRLKFLFWCYGRRLPFQCRFTIGLRTPNLGPVKLEVRNNHSDGFIAGEVFDQMCYDVDLDPEPATILDLGANAGFASAYFALKYPNAIIAAVEPVPGNLRLLRANADRHSNGRVKVFEGAISTSNGPVHIKLSEKDAEHQVAASEGEGSIVVTGMTVDSVLDEMGWTRVNLVKMDIEGYESVLLRENASWLSKVDVLIAEIHPPMSRSEFEELMEAAGMSCELMPQGLYLCKRRSGAREGR